MFAAKDRARDDLAIPVASSPLQPESTAAPAEIRKSDPCFSSELIIRKSEKRPLCFHILTDSFPRNPPLLTLMQTARGVCPWVRSEHALRVWAVPAAHRKNWK